MDIGQVFGGEGVGREGEFSCIVTLLIYGGDHSAAKAGVSCCGDIDRIACEAGEEGLGIGRFLDGDVGGGNNCFYHR